MFPTVFLMRTAADVRLLVAHVGLEASRAASGQRGGIKGFFVFFGGYPNWLVVTGTMEFSGRYIMIY